MEFVGWIIFGCVVWYLASQHDKKMNDNFMNFLIRFEKIEHRVQELEILNELKDKDINDLEDRIRNLEEKLCKYENPHS
ncbi:hypothetical protein ACSVHR_03055 [Acinetobacter nosocomialis]|uniref:hypothetical protein n=1 Tax=Acinetobacter nosocomialis TaxID=106654 RepID=UPI003F616E85